MRIFDQFEQVYLIGENVCNNSEFRASILVVEEKLRLQYKFLALISIKYTIHSKAIETKIKIVTFKKISAKSD